VKNDERTFAIVLTVTYSKTSTYDGEPEPVEIPGNMADQLHSNVTHCIERETLLNDIDGILEIETYDLAVLDGPMIDSYKRGYNWASVHGWVDEDEHGEKP
jgi:hypothetical protein